MTQAPQTPIAFLSSSGMQAGTPSANQDQREYELEVGALRPACAEHGLDLQTVTWDSADWDPRGFEAIVVGTTWDYAQKTEAFLDRLDEIATHTPVYNSPKTIRWNAHKTYLRDLAQRGAPSIPTLWRDAADGQTLGDAFHALDCDEIVVKPQVGAGAWRQARIRKDQDWPAPENLPIAECMVQPFLPAVGEGEYSFLYFGHTFSHCALKVPAQGDYRVQAMYGAKEQMYEPKPSEITLVESVLQLIRDPFLYARVDMMRGLDGELALMELEMIEPYLYPEQGPEMGATFAIELLRLLRTGSN